MEKDKKNKPKFIKRTMLALSLSGMLLATPAVLAGCQTEPPKDGVNGKTWHAGTQDPRLAETPFGENGDFYFDEDDFEIYKKVDGEWTYLGKIKAEEAVSVAGTTYVYGCDADLNIYVDITTHYTDTTDSTVRVYPSAYINVGKVMSLERAFEVAPAGANVVLKQDIELEESLQLNKRITIDFAGHTISDKSEQDFVFAGESLIKVGEGGELTLTDSSNSTSEQEAYSNGYSNGYSDGYTDGIQDGLSQQSETYGISNGGFVVNSKNLYAISLNNETSKCQINGGAFVVENAFLNVNAGVANFNAGTLVVLNEDETPVFKADNKENIVINFVSMTEEGNIENMPLFVGYNPAKSGFIASGGSVVSEIDPETGIESFMPCDKETADSMLQIPGLGEVSMTLTEDMLIGETVVVAEGVELTIDLNGHKIYNEKPIWNTSDGVKNWSLISVRGGKLTIKDSSDNKAGTMQALADDCYAVDVQGGVCVIDGGNFIGNITAVYVRLGSLIVNGGSFSIQQLSNYNDERYTLNCYDSCYQDKTATITVTGGTFKNFDPSANAAETKVPNNYCASGYSTEKDGEWYTVSQTLVCAENIKTNLNNEINDIISKAYNRTGSSTAPTYSVAEFNEHFETTLNYYVAIGTVEEDVETLTIGNANFAKNQTFSLSVGNNNFIVDKAFKVEDNTLYVAATLLANECQNHDTIKINGKTVSFKVMDPVQAFNVTNIKFNAGPNTVDRVGTTNEYTMNISSGTDYLEIYFDGSSTGLVAVTKQEYSWALGTYYYGLTEVETSAGNPVGFYPIGWQETIPDGLAKAYIGQYLNYSIYVVGQGTIELKLNFNVSATVTE